MKKFFPILFPLIALGVVLFLFFRWRTTQLAQQVTERPSLFGEGVQIENVSGSQILQPNAQNVKVVDLMGDGEAKGQIRYDVADNMATFSVFGELPEEDGITYQVWVKQPDAVQQRKAFALVMTKAGFTGTGRIGAEFLPLEVIVSKEIFPVDDTMETVLMRGVIVKPE
jgi:hypothetical protein